MTDVTIRVRDNGPLVIDGSVQLVDVDGKLFRIPSDKPAIALCRCGLSANKPFCDGAHKTGFQSVCRAET
jgi:CDGSH-type Zn-finger protein